MSANPALWGVETAAQQLAQEMIRALPVTVASVALWDQPSFALTVKAVSAPRPLPRPLAVGTRVPLSLARWHRVVFERHEPVFLEQDCPGQAMSLEEADLLLVPDLRCIYLIPILFDAEIVGILALGEMRSREREPFLEEKRRRCLALLEEFVAASAHTWEAGRLRRQVRAMSSLIRIVKQMLGVRSYQDIIACLASKVADWLGAPVRGILLRARPNHGMEVIGRSHFPEAAAEGEAAQLLLALGRAEGHPQGPISVVKVAEDPLDPLFTMTREGETWTRVCLPLLRGEQLLGIACLYVEDDLNLVNWELEAFRWLAETAAVGMGSVATLEEQRSEQEWLGRTAWELLTTHQRTVLQEALAGIVYLVSSRLPARLELVAGEFGHATKDDGSLWRRLADVTAAEITALLEELREATGPAEETTLAPLELNELVRRTVEIARAKWEDGVRQSPVSVQLNFEPTAEPLVVETSIALVGALVHAIESAVAALPDGGQIHLRTHRDDGHVLISVADTGPGIAEEHRQDVFTPLFSTKGKPHLGPGLWVVRALASRHGGDVELFPAESGGTTLVFRLPTASAPG